MQSIWKWKEETQPNINDDIFEATETTEIQFYGGHFLLTVKLLLWFVLFMIWCFCRLYLSRSDHITSNLVRFRFRQKPNVGKTQPNHSILFHLIIDITLCAVCTVHCVTFDVCYDSNLFKKNIQTEEVHIGW